MPAMRLPPVLAVAIVFAALVVTPNALACHGSVTPVGTCATNVCGTVYLVSSGGVGGSSTLALYQESNGIAGLQRGDGPLLQGGYDDCFVSGPKDERIL